MPKRIHIKKAAYLITNVTQGRFPFFEEDVFCNILIDNIAACQKIKPFKLLGFKINPEHYHIILQTMNEFNISKIMQNINRTTSSHINQIISFDRDENDYEVLKWNERLKLYNKIFLRKYNYKGLHEYPKFKWQKIGFDDQLIRNKEQLKASMNYLEKQSQKHELKDNNYLYISKEMPNDLVFIGKR